MIEKGKAFIAQLSDELEHGFFKNAYNKYKKTTAENAKNQTYIDGVPIPEIAFKNAKSGSNVSFWYRKEKMTGKFIGQIDAFAIVEIDGAQMRVPAFIGKHTGGKLVRR